MTTAGPGSDDFTADPHHDPSAAWAAGDDHARGADGPADVAGPGDYPGPVSEYPESGVNWEILRELAEKPHPLYDPFALIALLMKPHPGPVTIPGITASNVVEALDDVLVSHHLLDLIGVPHGLSLDTRNLDARVLLAVRGHMALGERLDRVAGWHQRETGPAGMVGDYCTECGHRWPCDTRRMADGTYADDDPEGSRP